MRVIKRKKKRTPAAFEYIRIEAHVMSLSTHHATAHGMSLSRPQITDAADRCRAGKEKLEMILMAF